MTYAVGSWWERWGYCRPPCCFLTFPSLCSYTALQSTLPLLPSSSSWLLCSLFFILVLLQCLCSVYFCSLSCRLWLHKSRILFVTQGWIFFLCLPRTSSAVESSSSLKTQIKTKSFFTFSWDCLLQGHNKREKQSFYGSKCLNYAFKAELSHEREK